MSKDIRRALMIAKGVAAPADDVHPASQIPGVHISERTHGKPIFTGERIAKADGGSMSVFPKPQRMLEGDDFVPGGKYLDAGTKEDVTGHKASEASIVIAPGGKPSFTASRDAVDQTGSPGRGSAAIKANLFKQKAGWRWSQAPEGHEDTSTIVSVEHRAKHHYALAAHFPKGVELARYADASSEPRLRPTTQGNIELGPQVGSINVRGREHPVYEHVIAKADGGIVTGKDEDGEDGIIAYQGGPHSVGPEGYDNAKIGTGEGAQVYGYGHYFAEAEPVAREYRHNLSSGTATSKTGASWTKAQQHSMAKDMAEVLPEHVRQNIEVLYPLEFGVNQIRNGLSVDEAASSMRDNYPQFRPEHLDAAETALRHHEPKFDLGHMHQVRIQGRPEHFLDWDKPLSGQSDHVRKALEGAGYTKEEMGAEDPLGFQIYKRSKHILDHPKVASEELSRLGIRGIRYLDQGSRNNYLVKDAPDGTANMTDRHGKVISNHPTRQEAHAAGKEMGSRNYVVFDPKHIDIQRRYARGGMAYADGGSTPDAGVQKALDLTRDLNPQGLYSHASEAAMASPQAKGPLPQMLASLKGVKPDEIKYSGVEQAFADKPRVTREELAQHFSNAMPVIREAVRQVGGNPEPKYQRYTLPGGENYREVIMHLTRTPGEVAAFVRSMRSKYGDKYLSSLTDEEKDAKDRLLRQARPYEDYRHDHWPQRNVVAHLRLKDRTGPNGEKILHAEEVQSDWGQAARREGTYNSQRPYQVFEPNTGKVLSEHASFEGARDEAKKHEDAGNYGIDYGHVVDTQTDKEPVPDAPYIGNTQNWTDLALKRLLHEAAAGGYDKVVYTPGAEQAKRYGKGDSSGMEGYYDKVVPKSLLALAKQHDPEAKLEAHQVPGVKSPAEEKSSDHQRLEELAGGELSEAQVDVIRDYLINDREERGFVRPDAFEDALDHAMRTVPDKPSDISFPGLTITPRMREGILKKGFKAYARGGDVEGTMRIAKAGGGPLGDDEAVKKALALTAQTQPSAPQQAVQAAKQQAPSAFFEIAPGKTYHPALQERWEALHPDDKAAISKRMVEDFLPRWQKMTGVRGHVKAGHGGFGGFTNPNYTFHPDDPANMQRSLHDLGDLFSQDAMMGAHAQPFEGSFPAGVVRVHMPKGVSPDEIHGVYKELNERGLAEGHSTDPEAGTMDILAGSGGEDTEQHAKAVADHLNGRYDVSSYPAHVAFPEHGADYGLSGTQTSGSPGTPVSEAHNNLRAEATRRLEDLVGQAHAQRGTGQGQVGGREGFGSGGSKKSPASGTLPTESPAPRQDRPATIGEPNQPPVIFRGREPHEFSPEDWRDFGKEHNVRNMGPRHAQKWARDLEPHKTLSGRTVTIPGGVNGEKPFSYYDLLHLKSQGIDPNDLDPAVHQKVHGRMVAAMQPKGQATPTQIANQMIFGLISPNQPLTPNELALQRTMIKGPADLDRLASMIPYSYKDDIPDIKQRQEFSRDISQRLGLHASERGGIGASGSANYSDIAEFAQKMRDRPDFFTFDPSKMPGDTPAEKWANHVSRVLNEVRGLKAKTGSLGSVWQSPKDAAISAIDRHMASKLRNNIFSSGEEQRNWESGVVGKYNASRPDQKPVPDIATMLKAPGGRGHFVDHVLGYVNNLPTMVTRLKKTGEYNPEVPEALRNVDWVSKEPEKMSAIRGPYVRALEANAEHANEAGQGLFSNQWMLWDRIRGRLEPHEILYPGLENAPRMNLPQMKDVTKRHSDAGYMAAEGTVDPMANASHAGYFNKGGVVDTALRLTSSIRPAAARRR